MSGPSIHRSRPGRRSQPPGWLLIFGAFLTVVAPSASAQPFELRTFTAGLGGIVASNGVAVADYNGDGHLDIYVVVPASYDLLDKRSWNHLYRGIGNGQFRDMTQQAGVEGQDIGLLEGGAWMGSKLGAAWGDYDNDGWPDLYLTHLGPNQLYHNNGNGTFTDVTREAGVAGGSAQLSTSALWFDCDDDGDLDLYVGVWDDFVGPGQIRDDASRFFLNMGDGIFSEEARPRGLADPGRTFTTVPIDVDGDGLLDLYNANDFGNNRLFRQTGECRFEESTNQFGLEDPGNGMGLAVGDPNRDGRFDIFVTNITGEPAAGSGQTHSLFLASEDHVFRNMSVDAGVSETGWAWGAEFFDMENDGDDDLFVGSGYFEANDPNALFENTSGGDPLQFVNVAAESGVADADPARGVVVFDQDGDGRLDLLIANFHRSPYLYGNVRAAGSWLAVQLEGVLSNRSGFGAEIDVFAGGVASKRSHHGAQFLGQNILPVHFGLADATVVDSVNVRWRSGQVDRIGALVPNQTVRVREFDGLVEGVRPTASDAPAELINLSLRGNFPNPFSGATQIQFDLPSPAAVDVTIIDLLGRTVHTIRRSFSSPGLKSIPWNPAATQGAAVAPGLYVYEIRLHGRTPARVIGKMLYLK